MRWLTSVRTECSTRLGSRWSWKQAATWSKNFPASAAWRRSSAPALDETAPPSKAATTLRPLEACFENGNWVRCVGIGLSGSRSGIPFTT